MNRLPSAGRTGRECDEEVHRVYNRPFKCKIIIQAFVLGVAAIRWSFANVVAVVIVYWVGWSSVRIDAGMQTLTINDF